MKTKLILAIVFVLATVGCKHKPKTGLLSWTLIENGVFISNQHVLARCSPAPVIQLNSDGFYNLRYTDGSTDDEGATVNWVASAYEPHLTGCGQ